MFEKWKSVDICCPSCGRVCTLRWQAFKNGTRHIRQDCIVHGYIRYVPQTYACIEIANDYIEDIVQTKL